MRFSLSRLWKRTWRYLAAVLLVGAVGYWQLGGGAKLGPALTVAPRDFPEQVSVSGTVTAAQDVDLGFAANGRIAGAYVVVGQHVAAGTILAETENGDLAAAVSQKEAALAQAQADLASLLAGSRPETVAVSQAALASAESALADAVSTAYTAADDAVHNRADAFFTNPRTDPKFSFSVSSALQKAEAEQARAALEPLFLAWMPVAAGVTSATAESAARATQGYLAQVSAFLADANAALNRAIPDSVTTTAALSTYQTSLATGRTNVNTAAAALAADLAALVSAQKSLALTEAPPTGDDVAAQRAKVAAAAADVQNAVSALAKTRVVAPFSGVVTRMDAKVGEIVAPTTSDISMQSDGVFQIETYVPEVSIAGVAVGDLATTTLDAYGTSVAFPAKVVLVDPAETVKDGVPTYKTTLAFLLPDPRIRSGMTANVVITTGILPAAIVVPSGVVGQGTEGPYVSVVVGKKAEPRAVTLGETPALGMVEITAGLSAGDAVLLSPAAP